MYSKADETSFIVEMLSFSSTYNVSLISTFYYLKVRSTPTAPPVANFPKISTRRALIDSNPGSEYVIYVVTRIPRLEGVTSSVSVVTRKLLRYKS